ncbi:MAG: glycosyltransferase [Vicinamibacterales bacterium]
MSPTTTAPSGVVVAQLSASDTPPYAIVAVFAHNESGRIGPALARIAAAAGDMDVEVWVLANGCTDGTCDEVRRSAHLLPNLWLATIDRGDKANAWNLFVHTLLSPERLASIDVCFFTDGDVTLESNALLQLAATLQQMPAARAAGGMPANGRDKRAWRERMVRFTNLAGNLYALRRSFVESIRASGHRIPIGVVFEDAVVSWFVKTDVGRHAPVNDSRICPFCQTAEFSFESMSPTRLADYPRYLRRKRRYIYGHLQIEMLMNLLSRDGIEAMPADVDALYRDAPRPSRLRWVGVDTPFRFFAVLSIWRARRRQRARLATDG